MSEVLLAAQTGRPKGSRASRRLRRDGGVPAVVYGLGAEPATITVDSADLRSALSTESGLNVLVTLDVEGSKQLSIVTDLQRHPVRRDVLHVDFLRIDPDVDVEVEVPLVLVGEAKKVTQASGMVDQIIHDLPIRARPDHIPVEIRADVSDLEIGVSLRVADIVFPEGVAPNLDPEDAFAVGVITRSTMEAIREEEAAEEELLLEGEELEDASEAGEAGADDGDTGDDES